MTEYDPIKGLIATSTAAPCHKDCSTRPQMDKFPDDPMLISTESFCTLVASLVLFKKYTASALDRLDRECLKWSWVRSEGFLGTDREMSARFMLHRQGFRVQGCGLSELTMSLAETVNRSFG